MDKSIGPEAFHLYKHSIRLDAADAGTLYAAKLRGVLRDRAPEPTWGSTRAPGPTGLSIARVQVCAIFLIYRLQQLHARVMLPICVCLVLLRLLRIVSCASQCKI